MLDKFTVTVRPIIFISAVSRELQSARQLVANTLQLLGYEPQWQDIFGTEEGDLRGMLRRKIDASAGVVQLVGQCYGAEPPTMDEQFGRVSYTQYEALYAKERGKKVWYLLLGPNFTADHHDPEPEDLRALQAAYRQRVEQGEQLYHPLTSSDALEAKVLKLRDDLAQLRRRGKQWAAIVLALLVVCVGIGVWLMKGQRMAEQRTERTNQELTALKTEFAKLREGIAKFPETEAKVREQQPGQKPEEMEEKTYEDLSKILGIDAKTLREKLPALAKQLQRAPDATAYERANAAYVAKDYAEAERLALQAADDALKAAPRRTVDAIKALELAGQAAGQRIAYADALRHLHEAASLTNRVGDPVEWARVQFAIASALQDNGDYRQAGAVLKEVVKEQTAALGPENPIVLLSRLWFAIALEHQGNYATAEAELRSIVELENKVQGPEHADTLKARNNLANALRGQGKYSEAEKEHRAVLAIREHALGLEHPDTLSSRNNLATTLQDQGNYADAEKELRAVLAIRERLLGPEHPDTLNGRENLATVLDDQGKYSEAEKEHRAVLAIQEHVLGPEHPDTLRSRNNLANALQNQGKSSEAEKELRIVLPVEERVLGPEHPAVFQTCYNLAVALVKQKKFKETLGFAKRAEDGWERAFGKDHPDYKDARKLRELSESWELSRASRSKSKHAPKEFEGTAPGG